MSNPKDDEIVVQAQKLTKSYDGLSNVLDNISFDVRRGETFIVIGPSGAGKTTLLRLIDLLDYPNAGKLMLSGKNTTPMRKQERLQMRRRIGMVFQTTILFNTDVYQNVAYGLRMRGVQQEKEKQEVSRALRAVGMEGFDKRYSKTLSGGEAQRIAIARVLAYEPDLILLDEPTANLDPTNTSSVERTILSVKKTYGTTILIATHNMFQAKRLADRVALLFNGKFVETGDPETIFTSPKEATTKAFINGELVY